MLRRLRTVLVVIAVAGVSALALAGCWRLIGGGPLPIHGWIALLIGALGTVGLTWGLMALAFKSDREGWDARVGDTSDHPDGP